MIVIMENVCRWKLGELDGDAFENPVGLGLYISFLLSHVRYMLTVKVQNFHP